MPAGRVALSWKAMAWLGLGKRVNRPSSSIALAPWLVSSPGWATMTRVPDHEVRIATSRRAVPTQAVIWVSWPQACMIPVSRPSRVVPRTRLAKGRPVRSSTGSASMSARSSNTGPGPFSITATTPVPPTPVVTVKPSRRASAAISAALRVSCMLSSGLAWRSR